MSLVYMYTHASNINNSHLLVGGYEYASITKCTQFASFSVSLPDFIRRVCVALTLYIIFYFPPERKIFLSYVEAKITTRTIKIVCQYFTITNEALYIEDPVEIAGFS